MTKDELVARLRGEHGTADTYYGKWVSEALLREAADFIEQHTRIEPEAVSEAVEPILRFLETGGWEGDGSDEAIARARCEISVAHPKPTAVPIEDIVASILSASLGEDPAGKSFSDVASLIAAAVRTAAIQSLRSEQEGGHD